MIFPGGIGVEDDTQDFQTLHFGNSEGILKSHSLSSLLNYLRAFGDGPVAGVPGGQGIESWLACLEFEPSARKDPTCRAAMHVKYIESLNVLSLPDGRGYELVSRVRALVPQKFSVEEELMHVKHVEVKSHHVGVMWKFGRGVISSGIVLVT
ncbi:hypothetical protein TNCV_4321781 [Trichonephila clavipes]|uniref:Uncharacterized protein n=1 Tax=Trichonephila clavipes TaxID=2585209 RepID=A0A8X6VEB8_TRICX|nr:hypothetical protein TNCV_4321781 [Trichonephila clavipes]